MNVKLEKSESLEKRKAEQFVDKRELPMNHAKGRGELTLDMMILNDKRLIQLVIRSEEMDTLIVRIWGPVVKITNLCLQFLGVVDIVVLWFAWK